MISYRIVFLVGILAVVLSNLQAQPTNALNSKKLIFEKLIYHSSHCNGSCPGIELQIDSNRNILLRRDIWKKKGIADSHKSGSFKGKLDLATYSDFLAILTRSDYANLKFPQVDCCDAVVTTIVIYANGKRTILKSMTPPQEALALISFLYNLGMQSAVPPTTGEIKIDEF
jgi:hypothetical protein